VRFDDLSQWARGSGLEMVLIVLGAVLAARFVRWTADRLIERATRVSPRGSEDALIASEASKHQGALVQGLSWAVVALIYFVALMLVLDRMNVPITTLVAPATLIGAAIGFGSQRLVQDILSGFFLLSERQYGFGDVVRIAAPGSTVGISGTVEELTLRTTRLRTENGEVVIIPNGEVRQVTNRSKDWARVVLDIPLSLDADIADATDILRRIGQEVWDDDRWTPMLLDSPTVMGVQRFGLGFLELRFVARTLPGKQWEVGRELRGRIAEAFREAGIAAPQPPLMTDPEAP
jgi:small conductance mechanosensitive channel